MPADDHCYGAQLKKVRVGVCIKNLSLKIVP